jgi:hypothetical protein
MEVLGINGKKILIHILEKCALIGINSLRISSNEECV